MGLWLLIPEHLRLGTWDLLCGWTGQPGSRPEPRLALQLVHEAALCTTSMRQKRVLSQRGFELEGDVRVSGNKIVVTYYNAPNVEQLRRHYEDLPERLAAEQIDSPIPWLYGYELDFRFR